MPSVAVSLLRLATVGGAVFCTACLGPGATHVTQQTGLALVTDHSSPYALYVASSAPESVQLAAKEVQRVVQLSTGALLPIVSAPAPRMIAFGEAAMATIAPEYKEPLEPDNYQIAAHGPHVVLWGRDSSEAGGSRGTLFAAYAFLEDAVGVRWLMPGPLGEDIPRRPDLVVGRESIRGRPAFGGRRLMYVKDGDPAVITWKLRQRLGGALAWAHGHSWDEFPALEVLQAHPEYRALQDRDVAITQESRRTSKLCTSNPGLLDAFAASVEAWLAQHPSEGSVSISPSDGDGWCDCAACRALDEARPDPRFPDYGGYHISRARRVLTFYNEIAKRVAARFPDRLLVGYAYASYLYPPLEPVSVAPNLRIVIAPRPCYSFTLYREDRRGDYARLLQAWSRVTPRRGYYDLPTWMRNPWGAPLPPGLSLLQFALGTNLDVGTQYVYLYGIEEWGTGALHNYVAARLLWNPRADVRAIESEWLARAYGPGYPSVARIFDDVEGAMRAYMHVNAGFFTDLTPSLVESIYLPRIAAIEHRLDEALQSTESQAQRERLELFGADIARLHDNLQQAGWLAAVDEPPRSPATTNPSEPSKQVLHEKPDPRRTAGAAK